MQQRSSGDVNNDANDERHRGHESNATNDASNSGDRRLVYISAHTFSVSWGLIIGTRLRQRLRKRKKEKGKKEKEESHCWASVVAIISLVGASRQKHAKVQLNLTHNCR